MTPNVSFVLLDAAVIAGRGEERAVGTWTHARLLEEVAAMGGVLRHLGVRTGVPAWIALEDPLDAIVAALATARVGGVVRTSDHPEAPVVVTDATTDLASGAALSGRLRLVRGEGVESPDLDWKVMLRAGRSDPAACEVMDPAAAYSPERSVAEQIAVLEGSRAPYDPGQLRTLLQV